jgi:hypothetical protein
MHRYIATTSLVLALGGCNALDEPGSDTGSKLFIPLDDRPAVQALTAPPPITGGTLAVSPDGAYAVAADPDRDRISIVTLADGAHTVVTVALEPGDEPGRVVIDGSGRAHVALRRGGAVVSLELATGALLERTRVCPSPRGLALDEARDLLHVACADGRLVTVDASGAIARSVDFGTDLRDVIVRGEELFVSTYKSAELLVVDAQGVVQRRIQPPRSSVEVVRDPERGGFENRTMQPHLAWRTVGQPDGSVAMLHQTATESMVDIDNESEAPQASPYGGVGGSGCQSIVQAGITELGPSNGMRSLTINGGVLGVDMARSPRDGSLVVALPGSPDPEAPRPTVVFDQGDGDFVSGPMVGIGPSGVFDGGGRLAVFDNSQLQPSATLSPGQPGAIGCQFGSGVPLPGQPTAVAFKPDGVLLVQSREPAMLLVVRDPWDFGQAPAQVDLRGESMRDSGHDLFHRDTGAGIACASCHGEGGDDGHTWLFRGLGARRTQSVNVGLAGTEPFHWDGDMHDLGTLMEEVFVGRMGGVHQSDERLGALQDWLFAQKPLTPIVDAADPAAERGKALFESAATGCTGCHAGESLTNNESYDVGTGERAGQRLQVPSLRGVGYRAPFIHNGCAETLRDRFDPSCGGAKHGNTAHLAEAEIDDLVAYLRSL